MMVARMASVVAAATRGLQRKASRMQRRAKAAVAFWAGQARTGDRSGKLACRAERPAVPQVCHALAVTGGRRPDLQTFPSSWWVSFVATRQHGEFGSNLAVPRPSVWQQGIGSGRVGLWPSVDPTRLSLRGP